MYIFLLCLATSPPNHETWGSLLWHACILLPSPGGDTLFLPMACTCHLRMWYLGFRLIWARERGPLFQGHPGSERPLGRWRDGGRWDKQSLSGADCPRWDWFAWGTGPDWARHVFCTCLYLGKWRLARIFSWSLTSFVKPPLYLFDPLRLYWRSLPISRMRSRTTEAILAKVTRSETDVGSMARPLYTGPMWCRMPTHANTKNIGNRRFN